MLIQLTYFPVSVSVEDPNELEEHTPQRHSMIPSVDSSLTYKNTSMISLTTCCQPLINTRTYKRNPTERNSESSSKSVSWSLLVPSKTRLQFQMGNSFYVISTYPLLWLSFVLFVLLCSCQIWKKMGTWGMPTSSVRNTTLDITQLDFYLAARYGCKTLLRILLKSFPWSCSAALVPHWNMAIKIARDWRRTNFFLIFSGPISI